MRQWGFPGKPWVLVGTPAGPRRRPWNTTEDDGDSSGITKDRGCAWGVLRESLDAGGTPFGVRGDSRGDSTLQTNQIRKISQKPAD